MYTEANKTRSLKYSRQAVRNRNRSGKAIGTEHFRYKSKFQTNILTYYTSNSEFFFSKIKSSTPVADQKTIKV